MSKLDNKIAACTGHRPDKLDGYSEWATLRLTKFAKTEIERLRTKYHIEKFMSGMALGWDTAIVFACLELGIPVIAAVPFRGQEAKWPIESQRIYRHLILHVDEVIYVSEGGYAAWKMQRRNEWMVDRCEVLLALWDGSPGGTANCLRYAHDRCLIENCWSNWGRWRHEKTYHKRT